MEADKLLCSEKCPCEDNKINEYMYMSDPLAYDIYKKLILTSNNNNIQDCKESYNSIPSTNKIKVNKKFADYWKNIEKRFNCVGFCQTSYYSTVFNKTIPFTKYLFSDFGRGPIKHRGCFRLLMNWIIKALISFGSLGIAGSLIQILIVFIGINMLKEEENEDNENDYKNPDNNNEKKENENNNEKKENISNDKKEDNENSNKNDNKLIQHENEQNNN